MEKMTINEALSLITIVKKRVSELQTLRSDVATTKTSSYFEPKKEEKIEPNYDIKAVDKKIVELETFLFKADSRIKQSNANTQIEIAGEVDKLLEPLQ